MKIGIIDYNAGNLQSVYNAIYNLGYNPSIIKDYKEIKNVDKLIIPGVGSANLAIKTLKKNNFVEEIISFYNKEKYILGICLGFQIFATKLFENGVSEGLGIINGDIIPISNNFTNNIGWNSVLISDFNSINIKKNQNCFYFCHSYYLKTYSEIEKNYCVGEIKLDSFIVPSIYRKKNFFGTQFHPEKSQIHGINFIQSFLNN